MNTSHIVATGGATGLLAQVYVYLTHWPLQPMDSNTATAFAGLTIMILAPLLVRRLNSPSPSSDAGGGSAKP